MNAIQREQCKYLASLSSESAAAWLMKTFSFENGDSGQAIALLPHRSWKRKEQIELARCYLNNLPFASARPYEAFASFMSISTLIEVIMEHCPLSAADTELLLYHLGPTLRRHAKSSKDIALIDLFLTNLNFASENSSRSNATNT